jgi:hypothetical protein
MTDTFHTPGFKLHCKILLHLFGLVRGECGVIKAPLWDAAVRCCARSGDDVHRVGHGMPACGSAPLPPLPLPLVHSLDTRPLLRLRAHSKQAKGPTAYPSNAAYVGEYVCGLLAASFPNMTPVQIQAAVAGMMAIEDKRAFKQHMRDFLVQVRCCRAACVVVGGWASRCAAGDVAVPLTPRSVRPCCAHTTHTAPRCSTLLHANTHTHTHTHTHQTDQGVWQRRAGPAVRRGGGRQDPGGAGAAAGHPGHGAAQPGRRRWHGRPVMRCAEQAMRARRPIVQRACGIGTPSACDGTDFTAACAARAHTHTHTHTHTHNTHSMCVCVRSGSMCTDCVAWCVGRFWVLVRSSRHSCWA